jgi:hypothetical protein
MNAANLFEGCANLSEARTRYRDLMREFHPDNLTRITQDINAAYEEVQKTANADGMLSEKYRSVSGDEKAERIVYRDRPVIVYVDRLLPVPEKKKRDTRNYLYCERCGVEMAKSGFNWVNTKDGIFCRAHSRASSR